MWFSVSYSRTDFRSHADSAKFLFSQDISSEIIMGDPQCYYTPVFLRKNNIASTFLVLKSIYSHHLTLYIQQKYCSILHLNILIHFKQKMLSVIKGICIEAYYFNWVAGSKKEKKCISIVDSMQTWLLLSHGIVNSVLQKSIFALHSDIVWLKCNL